MQVDLREVPNMVEEEFLKRYPNFVSFQKEEKYAVYWQKCMEAASDTELLKNIIFCHDVFWIPPVKTFLTYFNMNGKFSEDFAKSVGDDPYIRRGIGAFWGAVFKSVLQYGDISESVAVSMVKFGIKTASIFKKEEKS